MDAKLKHLEFIQNVITRMGSNSFLLKGWTVTLIVALFAFANTQDMETEYSLLALAPTIFFWLLDGFYLHQEKLYRKLYEHVSTTSPTAIDFSMNATVFKNRVPHWFKVCVSHTLLLFYGPTLVIVILASLVLPCLNF
ncbi:hypothetical protein [Paenibacillus amylolyticus]|uniref:hypothetical protein n=1 Tax=Paenibacillus amylolyticus TaxID=1451 RepID=UPI000FD8A2F4|nr:hypothetical protein [Paenibacillus amylolyticus]